MAARGPVVLAFFVPGASQCERQVSALQTLSTRFRSVQFAAVAINAGHAATATAVSRHRWTIPVAYDRDGTVTQLYDVVACPMVEMAARGGIVRSRLIGDRWQRAPALAPYVQGLIGPRGARG
jgi:peroxiredoxin